MTMSTIYVLYNAKASLLGKFEYTCRKISSPADSSPCSACDLTHGGLRLNETSAWKDTKRQINANVKQLHQDELTAELKEFVKTNSITFPAVLGQANQDKLKLLIHAEALSAVSKDHKKFLALLIDSAEREGHRRSDQATLPGKQTYAETMFDIPLRKVKDRFFEPLVTIIPTAITPTHLTAVGFILGILGCVTMASNLTAYLGLSLWLANRFFDGIDGVLARSQGTASDLGSFYDLSCDFIIYSAIPIAVGYGQSTIYRGDESCNFRWLGIAFVEATFHINNFMLFYSAAAATKRREGEVTSITMKPALIEGFESGLIFSAMFIWPHHIGILSWVMGGLVMIGVLQRFWYLVQILSPSSDDDVISKSK